MGESKNQNFNHLKIHSQYSICEGAIKIDDLKDFSKENKIKSLALCDTTNLCGALEFAEKISKTLFAVSRSKLPVGSSAKIICGSLINALAIETLCFSPPDSCDG